MDQLLNKSPLKVSEARKEIDRLIDLAEKAVDKAPEQAIRLAEQASAACQAPPFDKKPYLKGLADSYHTSASAHLNQGEFGQALKFHTDCLSVYQAINNRPKMASQLNNIGIVYAYCGNYAEALDHMRAAEKFLGDRTPLPLKAEVLNNIGFTYVVLGDYANAIPILLTSLATIKKVRHVAKSRHAIKQAHIYDSLCQAYMAQNDLGAALQAGMKSTAWCKEIGDLKTESEYLLILGEVYLRMNNQDEADTHYQQALVLARVHGFRREESEAYRRLGILHSLQRQYAQANQFLSDALAIASEIKIKREEYECHQALAALFKATGEFEKALQHYELFHQIKETVFNDQSDQRIKNLEMLHQVMQARREAEIHQQKSIELQREIVERKRAYELVEHLASTDSLTGIYNRRHFFSLASQQIAIAIQAQAPLAAIILDVDHFKMINDHYGHQEGDRTLTTIAQKISATLRNEDVVGRYGGEEFAVVLPQTDRDQCLAIAERLRAAVETLVISPSHPDLKVTISLGIATLSPGAPFEPHLMLERLLDHADQAMYAAKRQGRNRVSVYYD